MKQYFEWIGHGERMLPAVIWQPEQEVRAVLQITHGMTEHMGRYEALAEYLCRHGIAVAGFDLRGHGKNPGDPEIASFASFLRFTVSCHRHYTAPGLLFPARPFLFAFALGSGYSACLF